MNINERESGYTELINIASGLDLEWMELYILYTQVWENEETLWQVVVLEREGTDIKNV